MDWSGGPGAPHGLHGSCVAGRDQVLTLRMAFPDINWTGLLCLCTAWWWSKSSLPTRLLLAGVWAQPQPFLWCLPGIEQLLSKSTPPGYTALSLVLWLERAGFCWDLLCLQPVGVSRLPASLTPRKTQGNLSQCHSLGLKVLSFIFQSFLMFALYIISRALVGGMGKSSFSGTSLKQKSHYYYYF